MTQAARSHTESPSPTMVAELRAAIDPWMWKQTPGQLINALQDECARIEAEA